MKLNFKKANPKAIVPTKAHDTDAGFDLYVCAYDKNGQPDIIKIPPQTNALIETGIIFEIPKGYFGAIYARSGLASKQGLRPSNCVGVVDSGYINQVMVSLYNDTDEEQIICNGDRIAQIVFQKCPKFKLNEVKAIKTTNRGLKGFGSSGK